MQRIAARFENNEENETNFQEVLDIVDKRWDSKLKKPLHRAGYFLNPYYYYENKLEIELDGQFQSGLVACMEKMVRDPVKQDKILAELNEYQNEEGSFGRESAKRQRRNKSFDPGEYLLSNVLNCQIRSCIRFLTLALLLCFVMKLNGGPFMGQVHQISGYWPCVS